METLVIPKQTVTKRSYMGKDGTEKFVTTFTAVRGDEFRRCEAYGDHVAAIQAAAGGSLEVEKMEHNEQFGVWRVTLKGQVQFQRRPFTPGGYRGKVLSMDAWVEQSRHVVAQLTHGFPPELDLAGFLSAYWRSVAANITFVPGFEPTVVTDAPTTSTAHLDPLTAMVQGIETASTTGALDGLKDMVRTSEGFTDDQRADLYGQIFNRRKVLTAKA